MLPVPTDRRHINSAAIRYHGGVTLRAKRHREVHTKGGGGPSKVMLRSKRCQIKI
jgi:hypothetical protein